MSIAEQIAYIRNPKSNDVKAAALFVADAYEEAISTMKRVAQERQDALAEFRLARNRADALGEMLTAAENAAGCSVQSPSLVLAIKKLVMERKQIASMLGVTDTQIDDWTVRGLLFDGITKVIASKAKDMADADLECAGLGERLQQAHQMNANLAAERDRLKAELEKAEGI